MLGQFSSYQLLVWSNLVSGIGMGGNTHAHIDLMDSSNLPTEDATIDHTPVRNVPELLAERAEGSVVSELDSTDMTVAAGAPASWAPVRIR